MRELVLVVLFLGIAILGRSNYDRINKLEAAQKKNDAAVLVMNRVCESAMEAGALPDTEALDACLVLRGLK